jgi:uncharacterized membrane protein YczE
MRWIGKWIGFIIGAIIVVIGIPFASIAAVLTIAGKGLMKLAEEA